MAHYGIDTSHFIDEPLPVHPRQRYTKEILEHVAACSRSIEEMIERLGIPPYSSAYGHVQRRLNKFGIDTTHFNKNPLIVDEDELRAAVENSNSLAGVIRILGLPSHGTGRRTVKKYLAAYGISTAHFTGQGSNRGIRSPRRMSADEILRKLEPGSSRTNRPLLHRSLQEKGVPLLVRRVRDR